MSRHGEQCRICEEPANGGSLPINNAGDVVPAGDTSQEWAGVPCCKICQALYVAAGDRCDAVLTAYGNAVIEARDQRVEARANFAKIVGIAEEAIAELSPR